LIRGQAAILAMMSLAALAMPSFAQEGFKEGDVVSGELRLVKTRHPNGTAIFAYQIVSDTPKPLAKKDEFCDSPPRIFHIVANNKKVKRDLNRRLNKKVAVRADNFFCSHTAWHIGDAVVTMWRFAN
jgi:hypothetical protein